MKLTTKEKEAQRLIIHEIEKSHDLLITHLEKFCADTAGKSVPLIYIKESIKILLQGYQSSVCEHEFKPHELTGIEVCVKCGITKEQ